LLVFGSLTHVSLQQIASGALAVLQTSPTPPQRQTPFAQYAPAAQTLPQAPQAASLETHAPSQQVKPDEQERSHPPQYSLLVFGSLTQVEPQQIASGALAVLQTSPYWLGLHRQTAFWHPVPAVQTLPQAPQLASSNSSSVHAPSQHVSAQSFQHPPQWSGSVFGSLTQVEPQQIASGALAVLQTSPTSSPRWHRHSPSRHSVPAIQTLPQAPQWSLLVFGSLTHVP
jgi:hypothetical protein